MAIFSKFERMMAGRYLRSRRRKGFVSVIAGFSLAGIFLGVAVPIIVMSVMNGFRHELLTRILGLNGHLGVFGLQGKPLTHYDILAEKLAAIPGVTHAYPVVEGQVMASSPRNASGAVVRGMQYKDMAGHFLVGKSLTEGTADDFAYEDTVFVGTRLAEKLGLSAEDEITLISPRSVTTALGSLPRMKTYRVGGIFDVGMFEYDAHFIFMPLQDAQIFFDLEEAATNVEVALADADALPEVSQKIMEIVQGAARIHDWKRANAAFFNAVQVERNMMFVIMTLIIVVAAFNIISGLIMLVKDKGKNIAILRTMGATKGMIMRIFFMTGSAISVAGTALGLVGALVFCAYIENIRRWLESLSGTELFSAEIYFLTRLPSRIDPLEVVLVCGMALGLSFLATMYPAWRASKVDPVEALRYE